MEECRPSGSTAYITSRVPTLASTVPAHSEPPHVGHAVVDLLADLQVQQIRTVAVLHGSWLGLGGCAIVWSFTDGVNSDLGSQRRWLLVRAGGVRI
jgi:hypothetical protein